MLSLLLVSVSLHQRCYANDHHGENLTYPIPFAFVNEKKFHRDEEGATLYMPASYMSAALIRPVKYSSFKIDTNVDRRVLTCNVLGLNVSTSCRKYCNKKRRLDTPVSASVRRTPC